MLPKGDCNGSTVECSLCARPILLWFICDLDVAASHVLDCLHDVVQINVVSAHLLRCGCVCFCLQAFPLSFSNSHGCYYPVLLLSSCFCGFSLALRCSCFGLQAFLLCFSSSLSCCSFFSLLLNSCFCGFLSALRCNCFCLQ